MRIFIIAVFLIVFVFYLIPDSYDVKKDFETAIELLKENKQKEALVLLEKIIINYPEKTKLLYKRKSTDNITNEIKFSHYPNYFDGMLFSSLLEKKRTITNSILDSAASYIMFTSKPFMIKEHEKLIELFKNYATDYKLHKETIAIFEANLLLMKDKNEDAYKRLKETPYSKESIALLKYYSHFQEIPLFQSHKKLLKAMGLNQITLYPSLRPSDIKHYFRIDGREVIKR